MKWYADLGKYLRKASFATPKILVRMKAESIQHMLVKGSKGHDDK